MKRSRKGPFFIYTVVYFGATMKCLVKPTSSIMLILDRLEVIQPDRPSVVTSQPIVTSKIASGELKLVDSGLPDTATDEQYVAFRASSSTDGVVDEDLALGSFLASLTAPDPEPPKGKKK